MNNIALLYGYNNYFNRKMRRHTTLAEYLAAASEYTSFSNVINFTPGDGVDTSHIFNIGLTSPTIAQEMPDYMIVYDDSNNILQRWFVTDSRRERGGQYTIYFHRDVVAEAWTSLVSAPVFVEKATLPATDPMIFNPEDMTFNQIKESQNTLKDVTGSAWIVGYMAKSPVTFPEKSFIPNIAATEVESLASWEWSEYRDTPFYYDLADANYVIASHDSAGVPYYAADFGDDGYGWTTSASTPSTSLICADSSKGEAFAANCQNYAYLVKEALKTDLGIESTTQKDKFMALDNTFIKVGTTYYSVALIQDDYVPTAATRVSDLTTSVGVAFESVKNTANNGCVSGSANGYTYFHQVTKKGMRIVLTQYTAANPIEYTIDARRLQLKDQPYSMFCLPYNTIRMKGFDGETTATSHDFSTISKQVAQSIIDEYGGTTAAELYDIQLLPFCPFASTAISSTGVIDISGLTEHKDYEYIIQNSTKIGIILWCDTSTKKGIALGDVGITATTQKLDAQILKVRICSPNFNGEFDFNPAKNGDAITDGSYMPNFYADMTCKPYSPYLRIYPGFNSSGLYGGEYSDARGCICGGKFDLPQTSDAWASYERSNSNYNSIFDRQIKNLEVQNKVNRASDIASAIAGSFQGAGAGAAMGSKGGVVGTAVGAVAGGVTSLAGGIADIGINEKLRQENMDYTKDMYGYNLQNIQAQPESLTSVGAQTANNQIWPVVEVYKCKSAELTALINKIRYNGMTVGRIGTITEFMSNTWTYSNGWSYFKGKLIRLELTGEDWHFINAIKNELDMGIYIKEGA